MPTIVEVARKARVSATTVSHVVNGTRFVSPEARSRVELAIDRLGYHPNALARSLRRGQSQTLGMLLPDSGNPFFAEMGRAVEQAAFEAGYGVVLCNTENDRARERHYLLVLARRQVDGIVLVAAAEHGEALRLLLQGRMPVVATDRERPGLALDTVVASHEEGGALAVRHLLALGHRRIACVAGPPGLSPSDLRVAGWRRALEEAGVEPAAVLHGDFHPAAGASAARALLAGRRPPTAVFACNDLMAIGVLRAAAALGRRVPGDLAVVGYDDIELSAYVTPPLTTVAQPKRELGREAVRLLLERIASPRQAARRAVLPVELRVRASCGAGPEEGASDESRGGSVAVHAVPRRKP
jgi:LacI family transcriptional regulator